MPKNEIERVFWRDAHFNWDIRADLSDVHDDYIMATVGMVVEDSKRWLRLASEKQPHEDGWRGVTSIPQEWVIRREVLRPDRKEEE